MVVQCAVLDFVHLLHHLQMNVPVDLKMCATGLDQIVTQYTYALLREYEPRDI